MSSGEGNGNGGERLDSWKAITAYLGRDEATLRRWETTRGLPIRRLPGKRGASVYAYRSEIDAWLQAGASQASSADEAPAVAPTSRVRWAAAMGLAVIAAAAAGYFSSQSEALSRGIHLDVTESAVLARDDANRPLWVFTYEDTHRHVLSQLNEVTRISRREPATVFASAVARFRRSDNHVDGGRLTALETTGRLRWHFEVNDVLTMGGGTFEGPWGIDGFSIDDQSGPLRIAVAAHHYTWSPSIVSVIDGTGRRLMRYVNDGWMERVHWLPTGRLVVSGYSMARAGGMIALLDPARADGQSPDDGKHRCHSCGVDQPLQLIVMPRSEVNRATQSRFNRALVDLVGGVLVVRTEEVPSSGQGPAEAIYEFDSSLRLLRASYNDRYWEMHDQVFGSKTLSHDRANCPYRDGPDVYQSWSPETGWTTVNIAR